MNIATRLPFALLPTTTLLAVALLLPAAVAAPQNGSIVEGPESITAFRPNDREFLDVDGRTVDLRDIFEDMGEDATLWYQHVQTLANPFFEGRVPGSHGAELTAQYIEFYYRMYGLEPAFPDSDGDDEAWVSYRQHFEFRTRGRLSTAKVLDSRFSFNGLQTEHEEDFMVLGNSGSGSVDAPVTFVGYAIADGQDGYSSFDDDTDLDGRIALMFRYEPLDEDGKSQWNPRRFSGHASIMSKMQALEERGAAAILMVNPPDAEQGRTGLEDLEYSSRFGRSVSIPAIQITQEVAERILSENHDGDDQDLMAWRRHADLGEVTTVDLADRVRVSMTATVDRTDTSRAIPAHNVGGILRGKGALEDEWLVIGGHHDHVGTGMLGGTMGGNRGQLHPGADDNASGTAGVLIMARKLAKTYAESDEDLRSVLFLTFDAEELGLHGSRHYSNNPTLDPDDITAMLNMDMIGRLRGGNLSVLGTGTAENLGEILRPHFEESGLTVAVTPGSSGRSDDANFIRLEVPAMHLFTGMHDEYTQPGDQAYTVNPVGAVQILDMLEDIAMDFVTRDDLLVYTEPGRSEGQDRGYARVRLGIRPDMGDNAAETGIPVAQVSAGTSADEGGMLDGDVMVAWDGDSLSTMGDLMEHLRKHKPGDKVTITVLRGEERKDLELTLKASE